MRADPIGSCPPANLIKRIAQSGRLFSQHSVPVFLVISHYVFSSVELFLGRKRDIPGELLRFYLISPSCFLVNKDALADNAFWLACDRRSQCRISPASHSLDGLPAPDDLD
jgi:hypothetical protein